MQQTTLQQEFIRDITSVVPMSKSEAKRRLDDILLQQRNEIVSELIKSKHKGFTPTEGYGSEEEKGFQKGLIAQEKCCNENLERIITKLSGYNIWENLMKNP